MISTTDPLLLELTVADLVKRVDATEQQLKLALERICSLEQQLNQTPSVLPLPTPVPAGVAVNEAPVNIHQSTFSTSHTPEFQDVYVYSPSAVEHDKSTQYDPSENQVDFHIPPANIQFTSNSPYPTEHIGTPYDSSQHQADFYVPPANTQPTSSSPYTPQSQFSRPHYPSPSSSIQCIPIPANSNSLPSSAINNTKLIPVAQCLDRYCKLQTESKVSVLAVKLAREALFGPNLMMQCTTMGHGRFPGLPTKELNDLKQTIFSLFPKYWSSPAIFEGLWRNCAESIGQACKRLRAESNKTQKSNY